MEVYVQRWDEVPKLGYCSFFEINRKWQGRIVLDNLSSNWIVCVFHQKGALSPSQPVGIGTNNSMNFTVNCTTMILKESDMKKRFLEAEPKGNLKI